MMDNNTNQMQQQSMENMNSGSINASSDAIPSTSHGMGYRNLMQNDGQQSAEQQEANLRREERFQSIQRCIQTLVHACRCQEQQCPLPTCMKMKRVVAHTKICKRIAIGGCPICKQLIALCCHHAKYCNEEKCSVPFCPNIKHKLKQQQLAQRVQQAELLRHRLAFMNTGAAPMVAPQTSICGPQNTTSSVGLMPQMQDNAMAQPNQMDGVAGGMNSNDGQPLSDEIERLIQSMQNMMNGDSSDMDPLIQSMHNMMNDENTP